MPSGRPKSAYVAAAAVTRLEFICLPLLFFPQTDSLCCSGTSVRAFARMSALSITPGNPNVTSRAQAEQFWSPIIGPKKNDSEMNSILGCFLGLEKFRPLPWSSQSMQCYGLFMHKDRLVQQAHILRLKASVPEFFRCVHCTQRFRRTLEICFSMRTATRE
ncbi:hypothetical protein BJY00DRAFT_58060 [Aspergillus carlsbadensis]|nr:hypothetical protein BJY00DRAFT_58060 [Aspergillus carlsbadensis]